LSGVVLDTGALIALDRGARELAVLIVEARRANDTLTVPAGCVAQAWRRPAHQARLAGFLRLPNVDVVALDDAEARRVGLLLAQTRTKDVVDAHVAICAHRLGQVVLTSDPDDISRLAPSVITSRV
jgi:predicted nucleic acid-binding protein